MYDLKKLSEDLSPFVEAWKKRGLDQPDAIARELETAMKQRSELIQEFEKLQAERNKASQEVAQRKREGEDCQDLIDRQKELGPKVKEAETRMKEFQEKFDALVLGLPNIPQESVPVGASEEENQELHKKGSPRDFGFKVRSHDEIGEKRGWIDFESAAKVTGARFAYLKSFAARLERALIQFMLDVHTNEHEYTEVVPPFIVNSFSLQGTGNLPKFEEDLFRLQGHDFYLIPTAEVPLTNLHQGEILKGEELPRYYTAYTPCFRSEAGSYGKDLKGLIRQHQFNKVELVKIVHPSRSEEEHEKMRENAERILELLELPYRTVILCTGDMGFAATKTYDLEVWLPSQNKYREISSVSNCGDFQARRMNTRFKDSNKKKAFVHTLNGSGLAVGRTLIAILENYQNEDLSVDIPKVLRPYLGNLERA